MGKVDLTIVDINNVKGLPHNSTCYIRISHTPFILSTKKCVYDENKILFNQRFLM